MKFNEYYHRFPTEESCWNILKNIKEYAGVVCKKCGNNEHYWKKDKHQFECKDCNYRTSLKTGTVMENSNLPIRYWLATIAYLHKFESKISARQFQRELGHKRYEPIWLMLKKINQMQESDDLKQLLPQFLENKNQIKI